MAKKITDSDLLARMVEEIDGVCVPNIGDDYTKTAYYHNGVYTDFGMDVKELKNPIFGYK